MFSDKTALTLCAITLLLFFSGGLLGYLSNPFLIGTILLVFIAVIINLIVVKKPSEPSE